MLINVIGKINPPPTAYGDLQSRGLVSFLNNVVSLLITLSGIFVLVNFVMAGYLYLSASGNPQKTAQAGSKILNSLLGLIIIAAAFIIAQIIGQVVFNDRGALIHFYIYSP